MSLHLERFDLQWVDKNEFIGVCYHSFDNSRVFNLINWFPLLEFMIPINQFRARYAQFITVYYKIGV